MTREEELEAIVRGAVLAWDPLGCIETAGDEGEHDPELAASSAGWAGPGPARRAPTSWPASSGRS